MPTPQEVRFARLAVTRKLLDREQIDSLLGFQADKLSQGSRLPLWDCAVLQNMLQQEVAERLQEDAGDLKTAKLGDFRLLHKLGEGGMGSVYLGVGPHRERVAIKVLADNLAKQRTFLTRFFREGQAAIKLSHPNIVGGVAIGEDGGLYYFAMEYVAGQNVAEMIEKSGALPPERATEFVLQVAEALAYAHENKIIHRDIKPDNIMVTRGGVAKLMDLGLARQMDSDLTALTRTGASMGTPYYMAPEQAEDAKRADERSDIYSLGATWYRMVTGRVPFEGSTAYEVFQKHLGEPLRSPQAVRSSIPRGVSLTIERMMAKEPDRRIQTARRLCETIRDQCVGARDIQKELQLQRPKVKETMWDVKIAVGDRVEKRRLALSEVRTRIRKGQVARDTPAKPAGARDIYQPAESFRELAREFPQDYAVSAGQRKDDTPATRVMLHDLVTHYDSARKSYGRRKKLRKMLPYLIKLLILAGVGFAVWRFWPQIAGLFGRLVGGSAQPT
jgi:serine/threonine protein kinase